MNACLRRWRGNQTAVPAQIFPDKENAPKITFIARPRVAVVAPVDLGSPVAKRKLCVLPVTPDSRPADCLMPPPLELDECPKRVRFYLSLSSVQEHECDTCGHETTKCQGHAFDRSDLDYFEPCAGRVCLTCEAPSCGACATPLPLPFCGACLEMVVYESGSFVAQEPKYAQYLCKGGGDDCCCNALVCDACHDKTTGTRAAAYAGALKATRASAVEEDPLKYVVQEALTAQTRLCEGCVGRLEALADE